MSRNSKRLIAVIGATGQQGGAVVRALQAGGQFKVRALSRNPDKHRELADEVGKADLDRPETLKGAFEGAHGVFLVTNFWESGTGELKQATAAVQAAKDAGVKHFIWSTLPDVEAISGGKFHVPHFSGKARIDQLVRRAGFANHTFVIAPFYYQNLAGAMTPQKQADGSLGWTLPLDPAVRGIHMGDISELGSIVAGAFTHPDEAGRGSLGAVQVGMLKALTRQGMIPDFVVGASVGAINGAYFAAQPDDEGMKRLERIWSRLHRADIFPLSLFNSLLAILGRRDHLVTSSPLRLLIESELPCENLEDAKIPCHVVATDVLDGTEVAISTGSLTSALLASAAIPAVFPPVAFGGRRLMDG